MPIVRVAIDVPLPTLFDYTVEQDIGMEIGCRVIVPFGRRQVVGIVMEISLATAVGAERIKAVTKVLYDSAPLSAEVLKLLRFCSDYYRHPIGQTVMSALPTRLRSDKPILQKVVQSYRLSALGEAIDFELFSKRKVVQRRILSKLASDGMCSLEQIRSLSTTAGIQLKILLEAGWVESVTDDGGVKHIAVKCSAGHATLPHVFENAHALTAEQQQAVAAVRGKADYGCFLLFGITGSGKTEVYVHLMHDVLCIGGQVLLLVPEINLTPQLEQYFRTRFPDVYIASMHSGISEGERLESWQRAQSGEAQIILGTRLSVFAEMPALALIIVDEEHDSSYKQQDGLRYSARDAAIWRAHQRGIPIMLGSATPSLESYYNARAGRYQMLKLTGRAQMSARLPSIRCVNINQTVMHHGVSENLLREIGLRINRQEQSLLFINRRGYAPVLMCTDCGWLSACLHCAGKMVLHLSDGRLRCHHCGYQIRVPKACPKCNNSELHPVGSGTQRIENVLMSRFPSARIMRVDRDSTRSKRAWNDMREQITAKEVDILVGTQMLAKGHDFADVTLVGILNPDGALYSSDFRAPEKLFAQLSQVAGRAGRGDKPGEVLIQTAFPDHPLYVALEAHDFEGWANTQLKEREMAGFPPYMYQAMLRAEGKAEAAVYAYLNSARSAALSLNNNVEVLGVVPAALSRRANHVRAQLLIQAPTRKALQMFLHAWQPKLDALQDKKLRTALDVDPLEF